MSSDNCLISVIVPIYKVENYLERCIESIRNQTYAKLEIILVDDGSPDSCGVICDKKSKEDDRIKVIHKKNGGLSDARNAGIREANGEYLLFVDADDFISHLMIEILYESAKNTNADIVLCGYEMIFLDGNKEKKEFDVEQGREVLSGLEATKRLMYQQEPEMIVAWNKLEKKTLWNDLEFPVGKQHEDDFTTYKLMYKASTVVILETPLYYYLQRKDSIVGVGFNCNSMHKIEAYEEAQKFFKDKNIELYKRATNLVLIMNQMCCKEAYKSNIQNKKHIIKLLKQQGRRFYLRNFFNIKRGVKYHIKLIKFYF